MIGLLANPAVALVLAVSAPIAAGLAHQRSRNPGLWLLFGAILGPLAIAILLLAPPGRCPHCDAEIIGWPATCAVCGQGLRVARFAPSRRRATPEPEPQLAATKAAEAPATEPAGRPPRARKPARQEPGHVPATALGRRASEARGGAAPGPGPTPSRGTAAPHPAGPAPAAPAPAASVATGVFLGGSVGLEVGTRYMVSREAARIRVLGPIDRAPGTVVLEADARKADVTLAGDRLVIVISRRGKDTTLVLGSVAGFLPGGLHVDASSSPSAPLH